MERELKADFEEASEHHHLILLWQRDVIFFPSLTIPMSLIYFVFFKTSMLPFIIVDLRKHTWLVFNY
jgi:hypothetical protein